MIDTPLIIVISVMVFLYGLFSQLLERTAITAPIVFLSVGVLLGPAGVALLNIDIDAAIVRIVAELTLIMILFVDASLINWTSLRSITGGIPVRLLAVGLPLTMIMGSLVGYAFYSDWGIWPIVLMAVILSPTDVALGQAVTGSSVVPRHIRESISVESGLNDGIALVPVLVCLAALSSSGSIEGSTTNWLMVLVKQLTLGPLTGVLIGWGGGWLIDWASRKNWMSPVFQRLASLAFPVLAYAGAEAIQGNGFIAAFCAGLFLGIKNREAISRLQQYGVAQSQLLEYWIFLIVGIVAIPKALAYWDTRALLYALLSLTFIRMVPVALSLVGSRLDWYSVAFLGWFGPRGIASILYALLVIGTVGLDGYEYFLSVIVLTVTLSIVFHGISSVPMANYYKRFSPG
jgi:NhaP-type Na+/H+ or K+/H+ antiporter